MTFLKFQDLLPGWVIRLITLASAASFNFLIASQGSEEGIQPKKKKKKDLSILWVDNGSGLGQAQWAGLWLMSH